jgi:hypothetical protein
MPKQASADPLHGWTVEHSEDADGSPVCVFTKDGHSPIYVWGRKDTDPNILEERGLVAEEVRLAAPDDVDAWKQRHADAYAASQRGKRLRMLESMDAAGKAEEV